MLPKGAHPSPDRPKRGGLLSFAGAKVRLFLKPTKYHATFFRKRCISQPYTLYIIRARKGKEALAYFWGIFYSQ